MSIANLKKDGLTNELSTGSICMITGDGRLGYADKGPYDVIHVGAAAPVLPEKLVEQLAQPGRMFIPIGEGNQSVWLIDKDEAGHVERKELFGVMYVPLTDRRG